MKENDRNTTTATRTSSIIKHIMTRMTRQRHRNRPVRGNRSSWVTTCALISILVGFAVYNIRYFARRKARLAELGQLPYQLQQFQHVRKGAHWITESTQPFVSFSVVCVLSISVVALSLITFSFLYKQQTNRTKIRRHNRLII
jgi:nucleotidyltransferase/DNA polymerase involved in DNA repair